MEVERRISQERRKSGAHDADLTRLLRVTHFSTTPCGILDAGAEQLKTVHELGGTVSTNW
jgi:hypothetical protein